jgi:RHS repeat-associated protein
VTTYTYDSLNKMTQITYPDNSYTTFAYNAVGNKTSMMDTNGYWSYSYDSLNRPISATDYDNKTISYSYMATGQRYQVTDPDSGITSYSYDGAGRLSKVKNPLNEETVYSYNAVGLVTQVTYNNGTYTTYVYDAANRLTELENKKSDDTIISSFVYEYDKAGNRTKVILSNGDYIDYGYDDTYQMTSETKKNSGDTTLYSYAYTYNGVGNRETMSHYDGTNTTNWGYYYNDLNQLTSKGDGTTTATYTYDDNGNLTQKSVGANTTAYSWTFENKMKAVTLPDSSVTTFSYNPEGLRIKKIVSIGTVKYVLDGLAVLKEYDGSDNVIASYTPSISIQKASSSYFYHYDGLGNTQGTTDSSQNTENTYTYDAFGNILSSGGSLDQPYQYVGQEYYYSEGNIGLQLLGQRWYDAEVGRFVSRDPISYVGGINLYRYTKNNPVNFTDAEGLQVFIIPDFSAPPSGLTEDQVNAWNAVAAGCNDHVNCSEVCEALTQPGIGATETFTINCIDRCVVIGLAGIIEARRRAWERQQCIQEGYSACWEAYPARWQALQLNECMRTIRNICRR